MSHDFVTVPDEVPFTELQDNRAALSPVMYRRPDIKPTIDRELGKFLDSDTPYEAGIEPGRRNYWDESVCHLIKNKALQPHSLLPYPKGDAIQPINPRAFGGPQLDNRDVLLAKDSNVGEACCLGRGDWSRHTITSGLVRLNFDAGKYYVLPFLKHPSFRAQLVTLAGRGSTHTHARNLFLGARIALPEGGLSSASSAYIGSLVKASIEKEECIRARSAEIDRKFEMEMAKEGSRSNGGYSHPSFMELQSTGRLDTGLYKKKFKSVANRIECYPHGCQRYGQGSGGLGFEISRGQNLQVTAIGRSVYTDEPEPGFYRLALPKFFSPYCTITHYEGLGNWRELDTLRAGDILFGAEGSFRMAIYCDRDDCTLTNIHGIVLRHEDMEFERRVCCGLWLRYLVASGFVEAVATGGHGGSLAKTYWSNLKVPLFPESVVDEVSSLFFNETAPPELDGHITDFDGWNRRWNKGLGIWQLDRHSKTLQKEIEHAVSRVISGEPIASGQSDVSERMTSLARKLEAAASEAPE